jgi:FkbM family methyltransferase
MSHLSKFQLLRHRAKFRFEHLFDIRIFGNYKKTHGILFFDDAEKYGDRFQTIVDVGANIGTSTFRFREANPNARIYCIEPVMEIYNELESNVLHPLTSCHRLALGDKEEESTIYTTYNPLTSSLFKTSETRGSQKVEMTTLDRFAEQNSIEQIDLLKIDTEGYDLHVLKGAQGLLNDGRIEYVMVESGFQPGNKKHVLYHQYQEWFTDRGYVCFGIYNQETERFGEKRLRLANVVFCRE